MARGKKLKLTQYHHLLLFDIRVGPYAEYRFGGRAYCTVDLKIIDTKGGEILFQTSSDVGLRSKIPLPPASVSSLLFPLDPVIYELKYALGDVALGLRFESVGSNKILAVMVDSAAYRAGFQKGDMIIGANTANISTQSDLEEFFRNSKIKQGDGVTFRIDRAGKILEQTVKFPVIPLSGKEVPTDQPKKIKLL